MEGTIQELNLDPAPSTKEMEKAMEYLENWLTNHSNPTHSLILPDGFTAKSIVETLRERELRAWVCGRMMLSTIYLYLSFVANVKNKFNGSTRPHYIMDAALEFYLIFWYYIDESAYALRASADIRK